MSDHLVQLQLLQTHPFEMILIALHPQAPPVVGLRLDIPPFQLIEWLTSHHNLPSVFRIHSMGDGVDSNFLTSLLAGNLFPITVSAASSASAAATTLPSTVLPLTSSGTSPSPTPLPPAHQAPPVRREQCQHLSRPRDRLLPLLGDK